ncbi:MAG: nicotinate-nucleotide adenylyltransferase [Candidatus Marinimicrobia bacterium]|nr:nicotinate-nucleotide adenylyltransferase [Candidatus Neomarinimicrobiota bacterium]
MSICLFGGTFDPIHTGHLIMAQGTLNEFDAIDKIVFIPSAKPPHKEIATCSSFQHRFTMTKKAIESNSNFSISKVENKRPGKSYSIDTIKFFRNNYKLNKDNLFFLIGEDSLVELDTWKAPQEIVSLATLLVIRRPNYQTEYKNPEYINKARFVDGVPLLDISSSLVRENISQGKSIKYLVPLTVEEYIKSYKLYQG